MQLSIKTLLGLTLLAALLINGLINHFAARALQQELDELSFGRGRPLGTRANLEHQTLIFERAIEASRERTAKLKSLPAIDSIETTDPQSIDEYPQ